LEKKIMTQQLEATFSSNSESFSHPRSSRTVKARHSFGCKGNGSITFFPLVFGDWDLANKPFTKTGPMSILKNENSKTAKNAQYLWFMLNGAKIIKRVYEGLVFTGRLLYFPPLPQDANRKG
jgi:hypothetical protein